MLKILDEKVLRTDDDIEQEYKVRRTILLMNYFHIMRQ